MDKTAAVSMARTLMNQHGLGHVPFELDRAKRRAGVCMYRSTTVNGRKKKVLVTKIALSEHFVTHNPEDAVRDTILHEIAHALDPEIGHGPTWKAMARKIGAKPQRCAPAETVMPKGAWEARCPKCDSLAGQQHRAPLRVYMCAAKPCKNLPHKDRILVWSKDGKPVRVESMPQRFVMEYRRITAPMPKADLYFGGLIG